MHKYCIFLRKYLVISKKSSTFAADFENNEIIDQWYKGYYVRFWF